MQWDIIIRINVCILKQMILTVSSKVSMSELTSMLFLLFSLAFSLNETFISLDRFPHIFPHLLGGNPKNRIIQFAVNLSFSIEVFYIGVVLNYAFNIS